MTSKSRLLAIPLPLDAGFLQRQCPHCHMLFAIDPESFEERGLLNLRCPTCGLISTANDYPTDRQVAYRDAVGHHELNKLAEEAVDQFAEELGDMIDRTFRGNPMVTVKKGSRENTELPGPEIPEANHPVKWIDLVCKTCAFRFRVAVATQSLCPICR